MKRLINLLFFSFIFLSSIFIVSAQISYDYDCDDDQTIMRLFSQSNAHGQEWSVSSGYTTEICYDEIFQNPYPDPIVRTCAGTNKILQLSDITNAHSQVPGRTEYPIDICYGNLECSVINGDQECNTLSANHKEIVSLSDQTNAHIETRDANQYISTTDARKICCLSPSAPPSIGNAKWRYSNWNIMLSNPPNNPPDTVCPNIDIVMTVETTGISSGYAYFQMYEKDIGPDDPINGSVIYPVIISNNNASLVIPLSNPAFKALLDEELYGEAGDDLELYFKAAAPPGTLEIISSGEIRYVNDTDLCNYPKPVASIIAPKHRGVYFAGTNIEFKSGCSSATGPVQNEWTITQGGSSFTNTNAIFTHTFSSGGQVNVKLKCTDTSGKSATKESQMVVVASPYTLAYINMPEFEGISYTTPPPTGPYFPESASFSASDSFAIDFTAPCVVSCLSGNCPLKTENSPVACGGIKLDISNVPSDPVYTGLNFNWTFWDGNWNDNWNSYEGAGVYSGTVPYDDVSNDLNDKFMSVRITHPATGATADFQREFTLGRCLNNGNTYYDPVAGPTATLNENDACKGGDSNAGTGDDCCPTGMQCLSGTSGNQYSCQQPSGGGPPVTRCEEFTERDACNGNNNAAIPRASYGGNPPVCTFLKCFWDTSSSPNTCGLNITRYSQSANGCGSSGGVSCSYTLSTSECINGRKTITYALAPGSSATCVNRPQITIPCGALSFELPFFGMREFIISIILISSIYLLSIIYNSKRRRI